MRRAPERGVSPPLEMFEDDVTDRLFVLNAERAAEERALGLVAGKKKKSGKKAKKKRDVHEGQATLFSPPVKAEPSPPPIDEDEPSVVTEEEAEPEIETSEMILQWLSENPGWHARGNVLEAIEIGVAEWNAALDDLIESGEVERKGEKRGTRYRWRGDDGRLLAWWFSEHPGWHARQDIMEELEIDAGSWNRAIRELVESEEVVRKGEKRGTRYRWWEDEESSLA